MEQVEVKITGQAITARYGTLSTGARLVTDAAFAKHLVEDCGAAEYVKKTPAAAVPATKPPAKSAKAPKGVSTDKQPGDGEVQGAAAPASTPTPQETQGDAQTPAPPGEADGAAGAPAET